MSSGQSQKDTFPLAVRLAGPCRFPCLLEDSLSERLSKCNVENIFHSASQFGRTLEIASCSNLPRDLFSLCRFDRMLALRTHELDFSVIRAEIRFGADQQNGDVVHEMANFREPLVLHIGQAHTVIDRKDDDNDVRVMIAERTEPIKIWYPIFS